LKDKTANNLIKNYVVKLSKKCCYENADSWTLGWYHRFYFNSWYVVLWKV